MRVTGIVWMGVRTHAYDQMDHLLGGVLGIESIRSDDGVSWFRLPNGDEIQLYDETDVDHRFFGAGPVIGFRVDSFAEAMDDLTESGIELIGAGDSDGVDQWQHFRGPDGNVYEIIGPVERTPS